MPELGNSPPSHPPGLHSRRNPLRRRSRSGGAFALILQPDEGKMVDAIPRATSHREPGALEGIQRVNLSSCPHLTVVSRGERGKATLTHAQWVWHRSPYLTAEPQYRSGALKRSQFNAYQFMGVIPPFSGLKGSARL